VIPASRLGKTAVKTLPSVAKLMSFDQPCPPGVPCPPGSPGSRIDELDPLLLFHFFGQLQSDPATKSDHVARGTQIDGKSCKQIEIPFW